MPRLSKSLWVVKVDDRCGRGIETYLGEMDVLPVLNASERLSGDCLGATTHGGCDAPNFRFRSHVPMRAG
jgi:hypothetical protein